MPNFLSYAHFFDLWWMLWALLRLRCHFAMRDAKCASPCWYSVRSSLAIQNVAGNSMQLLLQCQGPLRLEALMIMHVRKWYHLSFSRLFPELRSQIAGDFESRPLAISNRSDLNRGDLISGAVPSLSEPRRQRYSCECECEFWCAWKIR